MNYRHIYHAGNFADVVKHLTLVAILEQLNNKEKPYAVLDAFAGIGRYNLASDLALKTQESVDGIGKLRDINALKNIPKLLQKFLNIVTKEGSNYYPGSPLISFSMIRKQDRLIATELHEEEYRGLKKLFIRTTNANIHNLDAYEAVKSLTPFAEKRGLIFLDPPFEVQDELAKLLTALTLIKQRASGICTLIWYPIKDKKEIQKFYRDVKTIGFNETLLIECELMGSLKNMNRCGLLVINPPNIRSEMQHVLNYLKHQMSLKFICEIL